MVAKLTAFYDLALLPEIASPRHKKYPGTREPGNWYADENNIKKKTPSLKKKEGKRKDLTTDDEEAQGPSHLNDHKKTIRRLQPSWLQRTKNRQKITERNKMSKKQTTDICMTLDETTGFMIASLDETTTSGNSSLDEHDETTGFMIVKFDKTTTSVMSPLDQYDGVTTVADCMINTLDETTGFMIASLDETTTSGNSSLDETTTSLISPLNETTRATTDQFNETTKSMISPLDKTTSQLVQEETKGMRQKLHWHVKTNTREKPYQCNGVAKLRFAPSNTLITKDESVGEHDDPNNKCIHFKE
ncbi:unnamed protein product [Mytilus edulis]|uniref:Uncharacterized protein n=1 Tax=Mytilus edulis TaxID=6550 RepID=A0A8S3UUM2_MYTED|nr:unnamed protein product [Mytilus edulis]